MLPGRCGGGYGFDHRLRYVADVSFDAVMEFAGSKAQGDAPERAKISCSLFVKFGFNVGIKEGHGSRACE